jgi:hypothetical protein
MNTKFFILLLISLLIAITTSPAANPKKEHSADGHTTEQTNKPAKEDSPREDIPFPGDHDKDMNHGEKVHRPNSDDDGKHHHFHYNRITGRKGRKWFLLFVSKLVLTVVHVCCFIYCFMHAFH